MPIWRISRPWPQKDTAAPTRGSGVYSCAAGEIGTKSGSADAASARRGFTRKCRMDIRERGASRAVRWWLQQSEARGGLPRDEVAGVRFENQPDRTAGVKMQRARRAGGNVDDEARACMDLGDDKITSGLE